MFKRILATTAVTGALIFAPLPAQSMPETPDSAPTITNPYEYPFDYLPATQLADEAARMSEFLKNLEPKDVDPRSENTYNRKAFYGDGWLDLDGNKCDTRNDILTRDLTNIDYDKKTPGIQPIEQGVKAGVGGCRNATVYSGVLNDPYTRNYTYPTPPAYGKYREEGTGIINFERGARSSLAVQIDHVIPLSYHYQHGGVQLQQEGGKGIAEAFANDPLNLLASFGPANAAKGDAGPSQWLPPTQDADAQCRYALRIGAVTQKYEPYGFSLAQADIDTTLNQIAKYCPASTQPEVADEPSETPDVAEEAPQAPTVDVEEDRGDAGDLATGNGDSDTSVSPAPTEPDVVDEMEQEAPEVAPDVEDHDTPNMEDAPSTPDVTDEIDEPSAPQVEDKPAPRVEEPVVPQTEEKPAAPQVENKVETPKPEGWRPPVAGDEDAKLPTDPTSPTVKGETLKQTHEDKGDSSITTKSSSPELARTGVTATMLVITLSLLSGLAGSLMLALRPKRK